MLGLSAVVGCSSLISHVKPLAKGSVTRCTLIKGLFSAKVQLSSERCKECWQLIPISLRSCGEAGKIVHSILIIVLVGVAGYTIAPIMVIWDQLGSAAEYFSMILRT